MTVTTKLFAAVLTLFALTAAPALASDVTQDRAAAIASLQGSRDLAKKATVAAPGPHHGNECGSCCAKR